MGTGTVDGSTGAVHVFIALIGEGANRDGGRAAAAQIGATKQMDGEESHEVETPQSTGASQAGILPRPHLVCQCLYLRPSPANVKPPCWSHSALEETPRMN